MQAKVELWTLKERVLKGSRWQDHQRLQFEVIHNSDTTLFKSLLTIYREVIKEQPRPLLRWAYANCTSEIFEHNICMLSEYTIKKEDYLTEEEAVGLYKQLIREVPKQVLGYFGLARAYGNAFFDPELVRFYKTVSTGWATIEVNGRTERVRKVVAINPERTRRYRSLCAKVREIEPKNPFIYYWDAEKLLGEHVLDHKAINFAEGLKLSIDAYRLGMDQLSPIDCLCLIVWFAWKAGRQEDMERYGEALRRWAAQAPKSPYVVRAKNFAPDCPVLKSLSR